MSPAEEAAAFWGSAENPAYPVEQRLTYALFALKSFGKEVERLEDRADALEQAVAGLRAESVNAPAAMYGRPGREPICDFDCDYCRKGDDDA